MNQSPTSPFLMMEILFKRLLTVALLVVFSAAITVVFTRGSLFERIRLVKIERLPRASKLWQDLSSCSLCFGVWVGVGAALWQRPDLGFSRIFTVLGVGCVSGCTALGFTLITDFLGSTAALNDLRAEEKAEGKRQRS